MSCTIMSQANANKSVIRDRDMEKYIRCFALKSVQAIVQARLGDKKRTPCKTNRMGSDWFHIAIEDHPEIQAHAKDVILNQSFLSYFSMCIEISLKTVDGDSLVLETWCLSLKEPRDSSVKTSHVYSRMTLLLKSILSISRVTRAYKLSSCQCSESYVMLYRIYFGPPQNHLLGEGFQEYKIGEIRTATGCLGMSVAYRTKMTITPQKVEKESPFMVKSDYFQPDMSPKKCGILSNGFHLDIDAFRGENNIPEDVVTNHVSCPIYCAPGKRKLQCNSVSDGDKELKNHDCNDEDFRRNGVDYQMNSAEYKMAGAFAPAQQLPDPASFPDLLLPDKPLVNIVNIEEKQMRKSESVKYADSNANLNNNNNNVDCQKKSAPADADCDCNANENKKMSHSGNSECEDFVMIDLKPPFADSDSDSELGAFFRECRSAPPLVSLTSQSVEEQVTDIAELIAKFETNLHEFDSFVNNICQTELNK